MSSEPQQMVSEATPATPATPDPQGTQRGLIVAAIACVAVVGLVFVGSVGVWALRHRRAAKPATAVTVAAKSADDDASLITETQPQDGRDPFLAQGLAASGPDVPVAPKDPTKPEPGTGPAIPPIIPVPPDKPSAQPEPAHSDSGSGASSGSSGGGSSSSESSKPAPTPKPEKPKVPSRSELAKLDPSSPPDWVERPSAGEGLALVGVVAGSKPQAVFESEGKVVRRRIGEEVGGMKVSRIERGQVMLSDTSSGGPAKAYWLSVREGHRLGGTRSGPVKTVTPPADTSSSSEESSGSSGDEGGSSGESSSQ
mgnify:CR=1 FL=1